MPYFTTDELRALPDMDRTDRFSDARCTAAHNWIVSIIERECDTAFIPTTVTARVLNGSGGYSIRLPDNYVTAVTAVTVDGVAYDAPTLAALYLEDSYLFQPNYGYWPTTTRGNVLVTYTHGYSTTPPADLKEAAMKGARNWLLTSDAWSGTDSRATAINNDFGNIQISVATVDHPTGIPEVDATIMAWARKVRVPKVR